MPDGVIGNTFDSESKESRFDPWSGNKASTIVGAFCITGGEEELGLSYKLNPERRDSTSLSLQLKLIF